MLCLYLKYFAAEKIADSTSDNKNELVSETESSDTEAEDAFPTTEQRASVCHVSEIKDSPVTLAPPTSINAPSVSLSSLQNACSSQIVNLDSSVIRLNSNSLILPQGNLVAVNGLPNTILNNVNNSPTILLNKPVTVPTLILMQNNFVPVSTVQQINITQRSQKVIVPKMTVNSTKTTFINKKPIPAVRLFKSSVTTKDSPQRTLTLKKKLSRRSKGILVKYPKRKPPTKLKKLETLKKSTEKQDSQNPDRNEIMLEKNENMNSFSNLQPCNTVEGSYSENNGDINKTYSEHLFDSHDIQTNGQFIDFFESSSNRSIDNNANGNLSTDFSESSAEKGKQIEPNFNENSFVNTSLMIEPSVSKASIKEPENSVCETEKSMNYLPSTSNSVPLLLKYVPSNNSCTASLPAVTAENSTDENSILDKRKSAEKELTPLSVQCNLPENKSIPKDLNLSFDDKKHYESSFDEFSTDLFTSLQVPSSGQNTDSISPTAAFLLTFPVVSSCKNADLLPEHEEDSNTVPATSTTILQIGNLESPSTLLFTNKTPNRESKSSEKVDESFSTFCSNNTESDNREKKKECKESTWRDSFNLDIFTNQQMKSSCTKESSSQNMTLYSTSSSGFSSYNIFTKYSDIPSSVTNSFCSLGSQPFSKSVEPITSLASQPFNKNVDPVTDFNSWMPSVYSQEEVGKEKNKRDKCTSTNFRNTFDLQMNEDSPVEKSKVNKKSKQSNSRSLVNWMTAPDLRILPDASQSLTDVFSVSRDDSGNTNTLLNSPNIQNNSNFSSFPSSDYYLENQNYTDPQLSSCKIAYSSANPTNYSWSPAKSSLPTLSLENHSMIVPSTLPTLVGDLALGNNSFNNYDLISKKYNAEKKKDAYKNYYKTPPQNAVPFLSVTQLVDDKAIEKPMSKKSNETSYSLDNDGDKYYKDNYSLNKNAENPDCKKNYTSTNCKDTLKNQNIKYKKDTVKYNVNRCLSKENKKDSRLNQKSLNDFSSQNYQLSTKDGNPLSNKNSNYSAESLISSSNYSSICSTQNYFSYDSSTNYDNCSSKRTEQTESLSNVGYYANTNYVYPNNFQSFNNYGFSNQCYNNYPTQIQSSGFQKKKDENHHSKQDTDWYKDSFSSYNAMMPTELPTSQKEKCKQTFPSKYNHTQKNTISSGMYNNYYQYSSASPVLNHTKSSCSFSSTYSFSQSGQQLSETSCQAPGYEKLNRNPSMNTNNVHPATTLTNFNLSTIFPEINDKVC